MKKILFLLIFFFTLGSYAQEEDPKVGLVLSGGGAKGLAHIGVLKVIEEAGIRIDYIGGTSMGAVIGALYASGYSASELDSIFHATNFNILIQDELPRSAKTFYEKKDAEKYAITLPFDNFDVSFPPALSKGQNVYNLMSKLTLHVQDRKRFEDLPIPFLAMATDVETGEEVILDSGFLPQAVSASAAIPTLFSPVLVEGRLLTDGGVLNNYPVEELRSRGAEIIIGVDVQDTLMERKDLNSAFEILTQLSNFNTIKSMREKIKLTDVYIGPDITPFNVMSFDKGNEIIQAGEIAAKKKLSELQAVAALQKQKDTLHQKRIAPVDSLYISDVRIEGNTSYPREYVLGKLKLRYPTAVSYKDLRWGINNLSATRNFNRINYQLIPLDKGYVMVLQLEENSNKMLLRLGVHYDNLYKSGGLVNLTRKSLFQSNDVASLDVVLGDNFRYNFHYYLDKGYYWSLGLRTRYNSFSKDVSFDFASENAVLEVDQINNLSIDYQDYTHQFYVETLFKQIFSLGMGLEHKYLDISSETIRPMADDAGNVGVFDQSSYYSTFGYLKLDSFDNKYYPSKGLYFDGDFHWYIHSSDFQENFSPFSVAKGTVGYVFSPLPNFVTRLSTEGGFRIGSTRNNIFDFFLGGYGNDFINTFVPFYGYDFIGLSGDSFTKLTVEFDYEFLTRNHVILTGNFANIENGLFTGGDWFTIPDYSGYAIGYGRDTFLGPVEVKYSVSPEVKRSYWFFSVGFWF